MSNTFTSKARLKLAKNQADDIWKLIAFFIYITNQ